MRAGVKNFARGRKGGVYSLTIGVLLCNTADWPCRPSLICHKGHAHYKSEHEGETKEQAICHQN